MAPRRCLLFFALAAIAAIAACGGPAATMEATSDPADVPPSAIGPTVGPTTEPTGDPTPTPSQREPDTDCTPPADPGPADDPPDDGGDLMDVADDGGARWSLCLTDPMAVSVEGRGSCRWSEDRLSVLEVSGYPIRIGEIDYGAWFALERGEFQLSTTHLRAGGLIATYIPMASQPLEQPTDAGRAGHIPFDVWFLGEMDAGLPPGAPPRHAGSIRWICGDPPPPA